MEEVMDMQQLVQELEARDAAATERVKKAEAELSELRIGLLEVEQKMARRPGGGGVETRSWGQQVVEAEEFKSAGVASNWRGRVQIEVKNTLLSSGGVGGLVAPDVQREPIVLPRRRPRIRDLLNQGRTNSNTVNFTRITGRTNNAAVVSEGDTKPESDLTFEQALAPVRTIAHWIVASRQILDDAAALQSTIDAEMRWGIRDAEALELLNGDGTGAHLHGIVPQATPYSAVFTPDSPQMLDTLLLAKTQLEEAELEPSAVVLHPRDWARIAVIKDSEGRYIVPGGPLASTPPSIWGMAVVPTTAMTIDKFLMFDQRVGTIYDRMDVMVEISTEDSDNFRRNLVTIRAEERLAFAVTSPQAAVYGDFGLVT
jgi:HK97 family phage major capsid protein